VTAPRPLAVTMGDPAGIGGELTLAAWRDRDSAGLQPFFAIDDPGRLSALAEVLGWQVPVQPISAPEEAVTYFSHALPVLPVDVPASVTLGEASPANAIAVIESIEIAVKYAMAGTVSGVVTQPVHKATLYGSGFKFPGHTEFLAHLTNAAEPSIMMLVGAGLRVVPLTIHEPLAKAIARLDGPMIETIARRVAQSLRQDFGITSPRIAIAGLNPHAGEDGTIGDEEVRFIGPAADTLRAEGMHILGPLAPDSMFHAAARAGYDAAICLYHDQGLIPLKTLAFDEGVNVTLGLPIVRTSPDHGTAFDIAGTGKASPTSFYAALRMADDIARRRAGE
jgi:4-hydroxythreonine-4-phosphate dehydrogenase